MTAVCESLQTLRTAPPLRLKRSWVDCVCFALLFWGALFWMPQPMRLNWLYRHLPKFSQCPCSGRTQKLASMPTESPCGWFQAVSCKDSLPQTNGRCKALAERALGRIHSCSYCFFGCSVMFSWFHKNQFLALMRPCSLWRTLWQICRTWTNTRATLTATNHCSHGTFNNPTLNRLGPLSTAHYKGAWVIPKTGICLSIRPSPLANSTNSRNIKRRKGRPPRMPLSVCELWWQSKSTCVSTYSSCVVNLSYSWAPVDGIQSFGCNFCIGITKSTSMLSQKRLSPSYGFSTNQSHEGCI